MLSLSWVCPIQREIINTALFVSIDQLFDNIILKCKVVVQSFIVGTMDWIDSEAEFSFSYNSFFTRFWWKMETTTVLKSEVAIASLFCQTKQPKTFLLQVKTIAKSPGIGIAESVKSCNLHKKRQF